MDVWQKHARKCSCCVCSGENWVRVLLVITSAPQMEGCCSVCLMNWRSHQPLVDPEQECCSGTTGGRSGRLDRWAASVSLTPRISLSFLLFSHPAYTWSQSPSVYIGPTTHTQTHTHTLLSLSCGNRPWLWNINQESLSDWAAALRHSAPVWGYVL